MRCASVLAAGLLLIATGADAKTYRIRGRRLSEEDLRAQYEQVRGRYVMHGGQVVAADQVGAFAVTFTVDRVVEPMIAIGHAAEAVRVPERPASAPSVRARTGKEFTIAETDAEILADISKGGAFAVRLERPATEMPLTGGWPLMLVDSQTYLDRVKQGKIKSRDLGKLRVLYDVTIHFDDFVRLLQRGQVFPAGD